ncbi:polysaccharide deacetylase family protein [Saccharophagus degradans]|uniref:polysaccharide deacetylase family protein n=1 Tax=Saccharophagus degradans TaxID=86304 RepID=UPI0024781246|nr:polysaccharide deacetylase family protein [Saccharophagus degradans]WGO98400.1 polysaccharide deacetylase family protein [Saccharophagus degradans]
MGSKLKKIIINSLTGKSINNLAFALSNPFCSIFMLHRFQVEDLQIKGHSATLLTEALEYLRKHKFSFISIEELCQIITEEKPIPRRTICFTLDDGFWDQAEVSGPIFSAYDCPATYFVVNRFLDNTHWLWDSKLEFLLENATQQSLFNFSKSLSIPESERPIEQTIFKTLIPKLKTLNEDDMETSLQLWSQALEVPIPSVPPKKYSAMNWNQAQKLLKLGLKIGPHSMTHPILANETDSQSSWQINESWNDLYRKLPNASPVFCYPVGRYGLDFGEREKSIVENSNMLGAVAADPGYISYKNESTITDLKRFGLPDNIEDFRQYATWVERAKDFIRK